MTQSEVNPAQTGPESSQRGGGGRLGVICVIGGSAPFPTASHPPRDSWFLCLLCLLWPFPRPPGHRSPSAHSEIHRAGQSSIRINDQYRVCFRWENGHADDVEVTDYH